MSRTSRQLEDWPPGYALWGRLLVPDRLSAAEAAGHDMPWEDEEGEPAGGARRTTPPVLPKAARGLYAELVGRLRASVVGHDSALRRMALASVQHMLGAAGQRYVLVGPSGVGKTTLARAVGEALEVPVLVVSVADMAETNWEGAQLADFLWMLHEAVGGNETRMSRALLFLDEIDKVGLGPSQGTAANYHLGKQQSLLGLLGGEPVPYGPYHDRSQTWSAEHALVISAGVFEGLPPGALSPPDLVQWGLIPELVGRLGEVLRLEPPGQEAVEEILWRSLGSIGPVWERFGLELVVAPETVDAVAAPAMGPEAALDLRSAARLLRSAAEQALVRVLETADGAASHVELRPKDLEIPGGRRAARRIGFG